MIVKTEKVRTHARAVIEMILKSSAVNDEVALLISSGTDETGHWLHVHASKPPEEK